MPAAPGDHVAVVIPALDEAGSLGGVLAAIAPESCGLPVEVIVVDDGSTDGTGDIARAAGAHVVTHAVNQGQGAAFRSGYALAREHGARYIVTLDADGQWDPADVPAVLAPVVAGGADLLPGPRVLGTAETDDGGRDLRVRGFSG